MLPPPRMQSGPCQPHAGCREHRQHRIAVLTAEAEEGVGIMAYTQENRLLTFESPLGADVFLLQGFSGSEGLSRLFSFQVDLRAEDAAVACHQLVGQRV